MTIKTITPFIMLPVILAISMAGCSKKDGDKVATQVVAKVNGAEISLHQVNHVLSKAGNVPADQLERARKTAVDRLIDQELLSAKAVEEKLDRTPETLMAIELARREVLARMLATKLPLDAALGRAELAQDLAGSGKTAEAKALLAEALPVLREHFLPQHMNRAKFETMARTLGD